MKIFLLQIILTFLSFVNVFAQERTEAVSDVLSFDIRQKVFLEGKVIDDKELPINKALITIIERDSKKEKELFSDAKGAYKIDMEADRYYTISVKKENYISTSRFHFANSNRVQNFILSQQSVEPPEIFMISPSIDTLEQNKSYTLEFQIINSQKNYNKIIIEHDNKPQEIRALEEDVEETVIPKEVPIELREGLNTIIVTAYTKNGGKSKPTKIQLFYNPPIYRNHALFIAVEDYSTGDMDDLSFPIDDADTLRKVLIENYTFQDDNITRLINPTKSELDVTLDSLQEILKVTDNLLIFYAGHGGYDTNAEKGHWLLSDGMKKRQSTWFRNSTLRDYIEVIKSKHILLISDACFSGYLLNNRSGTSAGIDTLMEKKSRRAITSGNKEEVPDKSEFLKQLIKFLRENKDDYLPSDDLATKIKIKIDRSIAPKPQSGIIQDTGDDGGDFIFIRKQQE